MNNTGSSMPQNVVSYVSKGTKAVNGILFLIHISFGFLFWHYQATILMIYSVFSTISFAFACIMLQKRKINIYVITIYGGLFVFMILAVICLGWEYGFQQYCISFVASLIFTDYYMNRERKISKKTMYIVLGNVALYVILRLWTYKYPYIYDFNNDFLVQGFYISNSLIGFTFLIMYSLIYSNTVRKLEFTLYEMANVDPLTGISNRRSMQQMLKVALDDNDEYITAIAMLDVDHFKKVNDTYGHDAGDDILVSLARILRLKQTENDNFHVSRWGGEEFLVFYKTNIKEKNKVILEFEELRKTIEDTYIDVGGININVTVTIGLAFYQKGENIYSLIKDADNKLYEGKNSGRNKVVV